VIIAAEGPTAAGKTTWCRRHAPFVRFVPEYSPTGLEPSGLDLHAQAHYWVDVNVSRWHQACTLEESSDLVVCDSDPLKLHYSWCLARLGAAPRARWEHELASVRDAFVQRRLGFPDLVFIGLPTAEVLASQRLGDPTRRRRHFELHAMLAEPLKEWYTAVEALDDTPRVTWELPSGGIPVNVPPPRSDRFRVDLLDALTNSLPPLPA